MSRALGSSFWIAVLVLGWIALFTAIGRLAAQPPSPSPTVSKGVLEHHNGPSRSGLYVAPGLTPARAARLRKSASFRSRIEGAVYGQPLYWNDGDTRLIIVATEKNRVYALDARTGKTIWSKQLGEPVPRSSLKCGDIDPLGVTGTPAIDPASRMLYLDAMTTPDHGKTKRHLVYALSLSNGQIADGWPVDIQPTLARMGIIFNSEFQNQRGALLIENGMVYVPYGGHFGDCGSYHGFVVGIPLGLPNPVIAWSTRGDSAGIWAPGGLASDGASIFLSTGNSTHAGATWSDGEAVIRLSLTLDYTRNPADFFTPTDWKALDSSDLDLGANNPLFINAPGASPSQLILQLGKDGKAYLLNPLNLGGVGGAISSEEISSEPIRTSPATYASPEGTTYVYLQGKGSACPQGQKGDLIALEITPASPRRTRVAWCAEEEGRGSPIITTTDGKANPIVWTVGAEGSNRLRGFDGLTGKVIFDGKGTHQAIGNVRRFSTLIYADSRLYVAADDHVVAFDMPR